MTKKIMIVTPGLAAEWLAGPRNNPRAIKRSHVEFLKSEMTRPNQWTFYEHGDPVEFDEKDRLVGGQHRLVAIVETGISIKMVVVRGVPKSAISYSNGEGKLPWKMFEIVNLVKERWQNKKMCEVLCSSYVANSVKNGSVKLMRYHTWQVEEGYKKHKDALAWLMGYGVRSVNARSVGRAVVLYALIEMYEKDSAEAAKFADTLLGDSNVSQQANAFKNYTMRNTLGGGYSGNNELYRRAAYCMRCALDHMPVQKVFAEGWGKTEYSLAEEA